MLAPVWSLVGRHMIHSSIQNWYRCYIYFRDSYIPIYLLSIIMIHCVKGLFLFSGQ